MSANKRIVTVRGPRGVLVRDFKHASVEMSVAHNGRKLFVGTWEARRKQSSCVQSIIAHVQNMITGVTKGYQFKMRLVHSHFPMTVDIPDTKDSISVCLFIGKKHRHTINMYPGVSIEMNPELPTELIIRGNDLEKVSTNCAQIHQSLKCHDKDLRKFLDGIFVSEKGTIPEKEEETK